MILGVIPARGGSKGVIKKNIRNLHGKPLITWTIEAAKNSSLLERFVVSTEDPEIEKISRQYRAEVLSRPFELATDEATTLSVLQHVLTEIPADIVVLLQCTSPVRRNDLIDRCITAYIDNNVDVLATGFYSTLLPWGSYNQRRQDIKPFFHDDGNVYVFSAELLKSGKIYSPRNFCFETRREEIYEIDEEFDFWINEQILQTLR